MLLLLSSDNSLNTRPINGYQSHNNEQWTVFKKRGLYFVHININSLLTKIDDELQYITTPSEAAVIGISQSKLADSVVSSEIQIENYNLFCSVRNGHGGGVACFTWNNLSHYTKLFLPSEKENIFT